MPHETVLIATLAVGLALAFFAGLIVIRLRFPPLIGYLLAGLAVGPFTPGFVADAHIASELSEIGVMLLMFGVGMHFSLADLLAVRRIAVPGAVVQIVVATTLGFGAARLWDWNIGSSLVFGLTLSVASTVVLLRTLEAEGALHSADGRIAVGWLIVEDLVMVLALVLLPAFAGSLGGTGTIDGGASLWTTLASTLAKVASFVAFMLVAGSRALPWLLERVVRTGSRELFTLAVVASALGVAYGAARLFGVSFALGAFFAGVIINGSDHSHRASAELQPLQDVFAALFFVSVGMLFDPGILVRAPGAVLVSLAIVVLGKSIAAFFLVRLFRYGTATALTVAASLAQVGEFSFILAGLGVTLGLLPAKGQSLVVAGALLSIALNPMVVRIATRRRFSAASVQQEDRRGRTSLN